MQPYEYTEVYFVYYKRYSWIHKDLPMYTLNVYDQPYYICIQGLLFTLNDLNIMVTIGVYFLIYQNFMLVTNYIIIIIIIISNKLLNIIQF